MIQDVLKNIESGEESQESNPLMLVHYNHNEAIWSDIIQKTPHGHFDKGTGLRSYELLGKMLNDPGFYARLEGAFKLAHANTEPAEEVGEKLETEGIDLSANYKFTPAPGDSMPEVQELSSLGKKGDDLIVLMPKNFVDFLAKQKGTLSINNKTGFPQFFFGDLKKIGGKILGVVGSGLAIAAGGAGLGPLAAIGLGALGGAAGSFAGAHLFGKGGRHAGKEALMGGLGGALAGGLHHWLGAGSHTATGGITEAGAQKLAQEQIAQQGAGKIAEEAGKKAIEESPSWLNWENAGKLMAVSSIIPHVMGAQQEKKALKAERARQEQEAAQKRADIARMNEALMGPGIQEDLYTNPPLRRINPALKMQDPEFYKGGKQQHWFSRYREGGQVKSPVRYMKERKGGIIDGSEKGQEDNVYTNTPSGTFILDASVVSDIGDGNTKAGHKIWQKFINQYTKNAPIVKTPPVKVALSAGEMMFPVSGVANLGGGSVEKGGQIMNHMIARIRKQKASHGTQLPPAALPLHEYLRGLV